MRVCFALIGHGDFKAVARIVRILLSQGHMVVVHYDLKSPDTAFRELRHMFSAARQVQFAERVAVGWGEWGVVQATLNCLDRIEEAGWEPDYVYLMSAADYPIRSSEFLVDFLSKNYGDEFIQSVPSDTVNWVKTGPQRERYEYHWPFNWRENHKLTDFAFRMQKMLGVRRRFAAGMRPWIGSQWWTMTWPTLRKIRELARKPEIDKFFRSVLVPDELFFQTLVRYVAPHNKIMNCSLTLSQFSDYGYPVTYYRDHLDYLLRQPFLMARKLTPHSDALRDALDDYWTGAKSVPAFDHEDVGIVSGEYEDWRLAYRNGPPGLPVPGKSFGPWHDDQKRVGLPYWAFLGASTADLRIAYKALSWRSDLRCHGQIFHPRCIEFADGAAEFAGYKSSDIELRMVSAPNLVSDLVRAEPKRSSGFLLRWGQGWHMAELLADRPNVRMGFVLGEPITAFIEHVLGAPLVDEPTGLAALEAIPVRTMAHRFRRFLPTYVQHMEWLNKLSQKAEGKKPRGWTRNIPVDNGARRFIQHLESLLEIDLSGAPQGSDEKAIGEEIALIQERRERATELLVRGGISHLAMNVLHKQNDNPAVAMALM